MSCSQACSGPTPGIVQAGRDRVRLDGLAVLVLQQVGPGAVQYAHGTGGDGRGVPAGFHTVAAGFEAVQPHAGVRDEGVEDADRVGAAADTGADRVRQLAGQVQHLLPCLDTEGADEVADHPRERVRAGRGAEQVVRVVDVGHPVAQRLVEGVLERLGAVRHRHHGGAQHLHPRDVQRLPPGVFLAHVDDALEAEQRGRGGARRRRAGRLRSRRSPASCPSAG